MSNEENKDWLEDDDQNEDYDPELDMLGLTGEELELIEKLPNDLNGDFDHVVGKRRGTPKESKPKPIPRFTPEGQVASGEFTDDDLEMLSRLLQYEDCDHCSDVKNICPDMFAHYIELAFVRLFHLSNALQSFIQNRSTMRTLGADTGDDLDVAIYSVVGEMQRLKSLIPKLRQAQDGMDSM